MDNDETILLDRLRDSDTGALDVLYLLYASKVRDFAMRFLGNSTDAEDITHDIFLKLWERRSEADKIRSLKAYLFHMTRNAILNQFKRNNVHDRFLAAGNFDTADEYTVQKVSTDDLLCMVELAIDNMPEQRRKVFRMSRYENMSYSEISQALDISPKTVQYHISSALAELRKLLNSMLFFV